jgi:hypothetical protein
MPPFIADFFDLIRFNSQAGGFGDTGSNALRIRRTPRGRTLGAWVVTSVVKVVTLWARDLNEFIGRRSVHFARQHLELVFSTLLRRHARCR